MNNVNQFLIIGRAILTLVNPDGRDSYILEQGHAQKIPAGTMFFLVNPDNNDNLRLIKLSIPVNNPHRLQVLHYVIPNNFFFYNTLQFLSKCDNKCLSCGTFSYLAQKPSNPTCKGSARIF